MNTSMIIGALLTMISQVSEVSDHANSVAYMPNTLAEVTEFLNEADKFDVTPVIVIDKYYLNENDEYLYVVPGPLKEAIKASSHIGKIVFMYDEPFLRGRRANQASNEILNIMASIKADFHGVEFIHIESFAELYWQKQENNGKLTLFLDADHIGFNCYGDFSHCGNPEIGVPELPQLQYISDIYGAIIEGQSKAKIFLVPGSFLGGDMFTSEQQVIYQLQDYTAIAEMYSPIISGFGAFIWGDFDGGSKGLIGARNIPAVKEELLQSFRYLN